MADMESFARELGTGPTTPVILFVQDNTIYYVSPTAGQFGNGQQPLSLKSKGNVSSGNNSAKSVPVALAH
jgi:hypothetical protein